MGLDIVVVGDGCCGGGGDGCCYCGGGGHGGIINIIFYCDPEKKSYTLFDNLYKLNYLATNINIRCEIKMYQVCNGRTPHLES